MADQKPIVSIVVQLPMPMTGAQIIAAVGSVIQAEQRQLSDDPHMYLEKMGDTFLVGQVTAHEYSHILVAASFDDLSLRNDEAYDQVVVMTHRWDGCVFQGGVHPQLVFLNTVASFTAQLVGALVDLVQEHATPDFSAHDEPPDGIDLELARFAEFHDRETRAVAKRLEDEGGPTEDWLDRLDRRIDGEETP